MNACRLLYKRYRGEETEDCESIDEAVGFASCLLGDGTGWPLCIIAPTGDVTFAAVLVTHDDLMARIEATTTIVS